MAHYLGKSSGILGVVVFASSWRELAEFARQYPGTPALVDPGFGFTDEPESPAPIRTNPRRWSLTPLIHYAATGPGQHPATGARLPFAARLRPGVDDSLDAIDATILRCMDVGRADRMVDRVKRRCDPFALRVFVHALSRGIGPSRVRELAADLGLIERTLQRQCAAIGIPGPKRLLSLARVFTVERLAEWCHRPSGSIALSLGFTDYSNYRRLRRRLLGNTRGHVGTGHVEDVIIRELAGSRSRGNR